MLADLGDPDIGDDTAVDLGQNLEFLPASVEGSHPFMRTLGLDTLKSRMFLDEESRLPL